MTALPLGDRFRSAISQRTATQSQDLVASRPGDISARLWSCPDPSSWLPLRSGHRHAGSPAIDHYHKQQRCPKGEIRIARHAAPWPEIVQRGGGDTNRRVCGRQVIHRSVRPRVGAPAVDVSHFVIADVASTDPRILDRTSPKPSSLLASFSMNQPGSVDRSSGGEVRRDSQPIDPLSHVCFALELRTRSAYQILSANSTTYEYTGGRDEQGTPVRKPGRCPRHDYHRRVNPVRSYRVRVRSFPAELKHNYGQGSQVRYRPSL